jgi:ABC transporter
LSATGVWALTRVGRQLERRRDLSGVAIDVEGRIEDQLGRHGVDGGADRHGHHPRVEVTTELPFGLEPRQQLLEDPGPGADIPTIGPNGAGKTTTVRTLGTLLAPTSGSAIVAGIPLSTESGEAIRARISIMPETPGLYLRLTVAENLECFARL